MNLNTNLDVASFTGTDSFHSVPELKPQVLSSAEAAPPVHPQELQNVKNQLSQEQEKLRLVQQQHEKKMVSLVQDLAHANANIEALS